MRTAEVDYLAQASLQPSGFGGDADSAA